MATPWQPGQLLFVGFEGESLPDDLRSLISAGRVGGVILFRRNLREPRQIRTLLRELHAAAPREIPLLVGIDQEGGRVQRLREPWTEWPPMRALGELDDLASTAALGRALAVELSDLGIGLDFAPVVDVDSNPANPVIGDRSFAPDPFRVGAHAVAFLEAMQAGGVAACAKHFPGHGDTDVDSHLDLPRLGHDLERLRTIELPPFRAAIEAGVASIMTAHVLFPALDPRRPATMSPDALELLRNELGYEGVVFTDDLEMGAVAKHWAPVDRALGPLRAGVDALLVCKEADLRDEMLRHVEKAPDALVERSIERVIELKRRYAGPGALLGRPDEAPDYPVHRELAAAIREGRPHGAPD